MKVAYLILAHAHPQRLRKLIDAIAAPWADIFVHIDKKAELAPFVEACKGTEVRFHEPRIKIQWGGWSSVKVQLDMLRAIRSPKYKYYKLLSGDCRPIKSRERIYEFLAAGKVSYLLFWSPSAMRPRCPNIDFYHFTDLIPLENFLRADRFRARPLRWFLRHPVQIAYWGLFYLLIHTNRFYKFRRTIPRRKRPIKVHGGEMWWLLRDEFVKYLLDFCERRPDAVRYFKYTRPPNEYMIPSILYHSGSPFQKAAVHLNHQKVLTRAALEQGLKSENILFARKFDDRMIALLERKLRGRDMSEPNPASAALPATQGGGGGSG